MMWSSCPADSEASQASIASSSSSCAAVPCPSSADGMVVVAVETLVGDEPIHIPVTNDPGAIGANLHPILVKLGKRLPIDVKAAPQPKDAPLDELIRELTDLRIRVEDQKRRAAARARLVYQPATRGQGRVLSTGAWRFVSPIGPIETEDLDYGIAARSSS